MSDQNPTGTAWGMQQQGSRCGCGAWVMPSIFPHVCVTAVPFSPPPASPIAPDVRLLALQEQIAKALERIADALEGLKPKPTMCGELITNVAGFKWICTLGAGHGGDHISVLP